MESHLSQGLLDSECSEPRRGVCAPQLQHHLAQFSCDLKREIRVRGLSYRVLQ